MENTGLPTTGAATNAIHQKPHVSRYLDGLEGLEKNYTASTSIPSEKIEVSLKDATPHKEFINWIFGQLEEVRTKYENAEIRLKVQSAIVDFLKSPDSNKDQFVDIIKIIYYSKPLSWFIRHEPEFPLFLENVERWERRMKEWDSKDVKPCCGEGDCKGCSLKEPKDETQGKFDEFMSGFYQLHPVLRKKILVAILKHEKDQIEKQTAGKVSDLNSVIRIFD